MTERKESGVTSLKGDNSGSTRPSTEDAWFYKRREAAMEWAKMPESLKIGRDILVNKNMFDGNGSLKDLRQVKVYQTHELDAIYDIPLKVQNWERGFDILYLLSYYLKHGNTQSSKNSSLNKSNLSNVTVAAGKAMENDLKEEGMNACFESSGVKSRVQQIFDMWLIKEDEYTLGHLASVIQDCEDFAMENLFNVKLLEEFYDSFVENDDSKQDDSKQDDLKQDDLNGDLNDDSKLMRVKVRQLLHQCFRKWYYSSNKNNMNKYDSEYLLRVHIFERLLCVLPAMLSLVQYLQRLMAHLPNKEKKNYFLNEIKNVHEWTSVSSFKVACGEVLNINSSKFLVHNVNALCSSLSVDRPIETDGNESLDFAELSKLSPLIFYNTGWEKEQIFIFKFILGLENCDTNGLEAPYETSHYVKEGSMGWHVFGDLFYFGKENIEMVVETIFRELIGWKMDVSEKDCGPIFFGNLRQLFGLQGCQSMYRFICNATDLKEMSGAGVYKIMDLMSRNFARLKRGQISFDDKYKCIILSKLCLLLKLHFNVTQQKIDEKEVSSLKIEIEEYILLYDMLVEANDYSSNLPLSCKTSLTKNILEKEIDYLTKDELHLWIELLFRNVKEGGASDVPFELEKKLSQLVVDSRNIEMMVKMLTQSIVYDKPIPMFYRSLFGCLTTLVANSVSHGKRNPRAMKENIALYSAVVQKLLEQLKQLGKKSNIFSYIVANTVPRLHYFDIVSNDLLQLFGNIEILLKNYYDVSQASSFENDEYMSLIAWINKVKCKGEK